MTKEGLTTISLASPRNACAISYVFNSKVASEKDALPEASRHQGEITDACARLGAFLPIKTSTAAEPSLLASVEGAGVVYRA